jgi:hypothetical protein
MALLMCRNIAVYDTASHRVLNAGLLPFDGHRAAFETWKRHRRFVASNRLPEQQIRFYGARSAQVRRRLSLSDCYWIRYDWDEDTKFEDVSPYCNDFTLSGLSPGARRGSAPDVTLGGSFSKRWEQDFREGGELLVKYMPPDLVEAEMSSLKLALALGVRTPSAFIETSDTRVYPGAYTPGTAERESVSRLCVRNLTDTTRMLITCGQAGISIDGLRVLSARDGLRAAGVADAADYALRAVMFDAVVGNLDRARNAGNWGFFKSSVTGAVTAAPLYDFNMADFRVPHRKLSVVADGIKECAARRAALRLYNAWLDPVKRLGIGVWERNLLEIGRLLE